MKRITAKFGIDLLIWTFTTPLVYALLVEGALSTHLASMVWATIGLFSVKALVLIFEQPFLHSWRGTTARDLLDLARPVLIYAAAFAGIIFLLGSSFHVPYSVPVAEAGLVTACFSSVRLGTRLRHSFVSRGSGRAGKPRRVLIAGAGETGMTIARKMFAHPERGLHPVGFLEDDMERKNRAFLGARVLGGTDRADRVARAYNVDLLVLAMPSAPGETLRRILHRVRNLKEVECMMVPAGFQLPAGRVSLDAIRPVEPGDLLRRDLSELDPGAMAGYLQRKTVMVTGAGGFIGSELVRQITAFGPQQVVLLDHSSAGLHAISQELKDTHPQVTVRSVIADVRDVHSLERVFATYNPQVVFHAAAHRHGPLAEENPSQTVLCNIFGTKNLVGLAAEQQVERFVHVSTAAASSPTSVMGATKRVAEQAVSDAARVAGEGQVFTSVRFGRVPESPESPVQEFKKHLRRGQSIAVPDTEMRRYFIPRTEAVQLILQAGSLEGNGAVYAIDMGRSVAMGELAEDCIRLAGLEPHCDVSIGTTGLTPEEPLLEEPLTDEETTSPTDFELIHTVYGCVPPRGFALRLEELMDAALDNDPVQMQYLLSRCIEEGVELQGRQRIFLKR